MLTNSQSTAGDSGYQLKGDRPNPYEQWRVGDAADLPFRN